MERLRAFWNRGWFGKVVLSIAGLLIVCCVIGLFVPRRTPQPVAEAETAPTVVPSATPTRAPEPTEAPEPPTAMPAATPEPSATAAPVATPDPLATYLETAKTGAVPVVRSGLPAGEWKAALLGTDAVQITFPLTVGFSNDQIVRLGKTQAQGIIKRIFDAAPEIQSVNAVGTLPDGPNNAEVPAVAIVVARGDLGKWDGTPDTLGKWNISQRLK